MSTTKPNYYEESITLAELVETDPAYAQLKQKLSRYDKDSKEYLIALFKEFPLTKFLGYQSFLKKQADQIPGTEHIKGYSPVYRSSLSPKHLVSAVHPELRTGLELFNFTVDRYPDSDCLGTRIKDPITGELSNYYVFETYKEVQKRSRNFGSGIMSVVNIKRHKDFHENDFIVAILSYNRKEWIITDLACQSYSLANTALYDTLGPETSEYIMNLTEAPVLVLSKSSVFKILNILPRLKNLNTIICMDDLDSAELDQLNHFLLPVAKNSKGEKISVFTMKQIEEIGALNQIPIIPPKPETLYTISFTSGTTGLPKGVEMNHIHLSSGTVLALSTLRITPDKHAKQLYDMCFLPLAHIFERMIISYELATGVGIGFLHAPDPSVFVEDLKVLKPNVLALVPRILTRFEAGIKNSLNSDTTSHLVKSMTQNILETKRSTFTKRDGPDQSLMNSMVFHPILIDKIRKSLGLDNVSLIITGSAPISEDTLIFMKSALDCGVRQGYGMTETYAGICLSESHEKDSGSCGGIGLSTECRLKSVPEMGYDAEHDLKGELQLRGPQIFENYYKNPVETEKAMDSDGWFSTGDIGYIDEKGRIRIIDRVKNFFKLAQGEYIAPEKIENNYLSSCPYITQIFVHGDPLQTYLIGVVGLDVQSIKHMLSRKHRTLKHLSTEHFIQQINSDLRLKRDVLNLINSSIRGLQGFEKLHNIHVGLEPLKLEDDTVTPTLKVKRAAATKFFRKTLDSLYEEGSIMKSEKL